MYIAPDSKYPNAVPVFAYKYLFSFFFFWQAQKNTNRVSLQSRALSSTNRVAIGSNIVAARNLVSIFIVSLNFIVQKKKNEFEPDKKINERRKRWLNEWKARVWLNNKRHLRLLCIRFSPTTRPVRSLWFLMFDFDVWVLSLILIFLTRCFGCE